MKEGGEHRPRAALTVASLALFTDALLYGLAVPVLPLLASDRGASAIGVGLLSPPTLPRWSRRARLGWLAPAACGVRGRLQSQPGGRMLYLLEAPRSALGVIRAAVAVYDGVELRDPAPLNVTDSAPSEKHDDSADGDLAGERSTVMDEDLDG